MKRKIIAFLLSFTVILGLFSFGCKREEKSVNAVVLVEFSDTETAFTKDDQTLLEGVFNGEESLDNFIEKNSNGNRGVESVFVGKVKIDKPIDYFMPKYEYNLFRGEYETVNEIGYDNRFLTDYGNVDLDGKQSVERFLREQKLLDLVTEKLSGYRFARGVEIENLTLIPCKLNRGVVENSLFWAHQSRVYSGSIESLSSVYYTGDKTGELSKIKLGNRSINSYIIMPYAFINSSEKVNITTLCHEYMHVLGAPDLYSYTNSSVDFVGEFDLLGKQETEIPNLSLSYIRYKMGWLDENEDIMPISKSGEYILSPAEEGEGVVAYKITLHDYYERGESFYVEYRNLGEGSLSSSNTEGLIVYRVSQTAGYTSSSGEIANSWKGNAYANEVYVYRFWREKLDGGYEERNSVTTSGICYATVGDKVGYDSFGNKNGEVNAITYSDGTNSKITVTYGGKTADGKVKFSVDIPDWKDEISSEKIVSLTGGRNLLYFDRRSENCTAYVVYTDKKIANPSASKLTSGKYGEPIVLNTTFLKADLPKADGYEKYVYVCYKEGETLSKVTSHYIAGVKNIPFVIIIIIALAVGVIVPTAVLKGVKFISKKGVKMSDKRPIDQDNNENSNYFNYAPTPPERKSFLNEENPPRQIQDEKPDGEKAAHSGEPSQEPSPNGYFSPRQNLPLESGNSEEKFRYESDFSGKVNLNADFKEQEEAQNRDKRFFGFGIASMVLGIISLICCCVTAFSLIMGLLAVAFAITRMKIKPDGFAIAGIITGGIGFLFAVATIILEASGVKVPTPNSLLDGESMRALLTAILFRIS